jgi:hypothetical protein
MNRTLYLQCASSIRIGRIRTEVAAAPAKSAQEIAGFAAGFEVNVSRLSVSERSHLLSSLLPMLERERRKCKARAGRYDAGRHISLYFAVKSLTQTVK